MAMDSSSKGSDLQLGGSTHHILRDDNATKLRCRTVRIEIVSGPEAGRRVELPGPEVRIGSASGCDMILKDPTVSRHHFTLKIDGGRIRIIDAHSRNGTVVDGLSIRDVYARPDSAITVGTTQMRLRLLETEVELPLYPRDHFGPLLGSSIGMRRMFAVLERVSPTDTTVLIEGETGTGKELVAEAIHEASARQGGPFIVFDCSAVSANLIESELFGHVRGAFTGADRDRVGAFEAADGGTLFLDELGELPLDLQPKLLRALERLEIKRVGATNTKRVDVRVVAATNRSLAAEVERGTFREDLYYRLAVVRVEIPPLRERPEDIPILARNFAKRVRGGVLSEISERTIRLYQSQAWPGNVRELRNSVARALSLGETSAPAEAGSFSSTPNVQSGQTPYTIDLAVPLKQARDEVTDAFERIYLAEALRHTGGNVTRAAEIAGVNRKFIQRALRRYDLRQGGDLGASGQGAGPTGSGFQRDAAQTGDGDLGSVTLDDGEKITSTSNRPL